MNKNYAVMAVATVLGASAPVAMADSISPTSFSATLGIGESATVNKTVTVSAGKPTSSKVDVFFLADTTGSMSGPIGSVKSAASSILSQAALLGDVQFAVGYYSGEIGDDSYGLYQAMTSSQASAQAAINTWAACVPNCGGDTPEANLYGLFHAADDAATGWRPGSERILIWFGDARAHDPSPGGTTPSDGKKTEAQTIAALQAAGVNVQAINVGNLDSTGQATRIADATGGEYYPSINTGTIVATINDAIETTVSTYSSVGLDLSEVPAGVGVEVTPSNHVGAFDRSIEREFEFDLKFTGLAPGTYSFNVYGTVDGGRVATEADRIVVTGGGTGVPDGGQAMLLLVASMGLVGMAKRRMTV